MKNLKSNDLEQISCCFDSNNFLPKLQDCEDLLVSIKVSEITDKAIQKRVIALENYLAKALIQAKKINACYYESRNELTRQYRASNIAAMRVNCLTCLSKIGKAKDIKSFEEIDKGTFDLTGLSEREMSACNAYWAALNSNWF